MQIKNSSSRGRSRSKGGFSDVDSMRIDMLQSRREHFSVVFLFTRGGVLYEARVLE